MNKQVIKTCAVILLLQSASSTQSMSRFVRPAQRLTTSAVRSLRYIFPEDELAYGKITRNLPDGTIETTTTNNFKITEHPDGRKEIFYFKNNDSYHVTIDPDNTITSRLDYCTLIERPCGTTELHDTAREEKVIKEPCGTIKLLIKNGDTYTESQEDRYKLEWRLIVPEINAKAIRTFRT